MKREVSGNRPEQKPRRLPSTAYKPGQSGNPNGRPKDGESFASVLRNLLAKDGPEIAKMCKVYAKEFSVYPAGVDMRHIVVMRWLASLLNEPSTGLLQQMIDRTDGPVPSVLKGDSESPILIKIDR